MPKTCACGCGTEIASYSTWAPGHNKRGLPRTVTGTPLEENGASLPPSESSSFHLDEEDLKEIETWTKSTGLDGLEETLKVHIYPTFGEQDKGDGGIRRVVEGQRKHLPKFGIEVVEDPKDADVIVFHATVPSTYLKLYPDKTFVAMCHGLYWSEYEWDNWSLKANADVMEGIRCADAVIACSNWVANSIRRHTSRKTDVIFHGIDADEWEAIDTRDYVLWNKT